MGRYALAFGMIGPVMIRGQNLSIPYCGPIVAFVIDDLSRFMSFEQKRLKISIEKIFNITKSVIFINTSRVRWRMRQRVDAWKVAQGSRPRRSGHEPDIEDSPLLPYARSHDNLIITPHCGGFSPDAVAIVCTRAAEKIREFFQL
jgi:hypothetical protein